MLIKCTPCNREHQLNARQSRWALLAIQDGDAQFMTRSGVLTMCLEDASIIGYSQEVANSSDTASIAV